MSAHPGPGLLPLILTRRQAKLAELPLGEPQSLFLEGPAGSGKTTAGVARLLHLLALGVPADSILVLVPQRTLGRAYYEALRSPGVPAGARVDVLTIGGLAQRAVELYWPLVAGPAGFAHPDQPPTFLTLETAQYHMDRLVAPAMAEGAFGDVTLSRQRLISQILDDLNKAAVARFPASEIGLRLSQAWNGESSRLRVYQKVQECADAFRRFCLEHNLLDFSLQIEVFARYVLALPEAEAALRSRYRHLLADNIEEDVPVTHDLLAGWLPGCDSAWLIYDEQGGLRTYLGADPASAYALRERCQARERLDEPIAKQTSLWALAMGLGRSLGMLTPGPEADPRPALTLLSYRYHTEAIGAVAAEVGRLVHGQGVSPGRIAIVAPFMGDALRFALATALDREGVPSYSQRPSRALRDEPAVRCLLTLARLAHPAWNLPPLKTDVAHALVAAIAELDLVRAWHLASIVYRGSKEKAALASFEQVRAEEQLKITYLLGNRYEALRRWLAAYAEGPALPLDHFFSRLFEEVLSRPGYVFHRDRDSAAATAHLIDSAFKFRQALEPWGPTENRGSCPTAKTANSAEDVGAKHWGGVWRDRPESSAPPMLRPYQQGAEAAGQHEPDPAVAISFVQMVEQGVIAAQYLPPEALAEEAVLLAPAYTFAMGDRPVDYQFWLDLASTSWGRRLYQPLTHPYVLTRQWPAGRKWTDADEDLSNRQLLYRLAVALIRRCRKGIYLADSTYNERGLEEHGPLQQAIFRTLRRAAREQPVAGKAEGTEGERS